MNKLALFLCVFFITSCAETKDMLSMGEPEPLDEFSVMQTKSLDIPPDFELVPPVDKSKELDTNGSTEVKVEGEVSDNEKEILEKMDISDKNKDYEPTGADKEFLDKL